jgi:toxin HigB-1
MIVSFKCRDTQTLFSGVRVRRLTNFERVAVRKLQQINAAADLDFLRIPPQNRLEQLKGDRKGQYSVRINGQFRICFRFTGGNAFDVEIVDYH